MIVVCPDCRTRYRPPEQDAVTGHRARCGLCDSVFQITRPLRPYRLVEAPAAGTGAGTAYAADAIAAAVRLAEPSPASAPMTIGMDDPTLAERVRHSGPESDAPGPRPPLTYRVLVEDADEPSPPPPGAVPTPADAAAEPPPVATRPRRPPRAARAPAASAPAAASRPVRPRPASRVAARAAGRPLRRSGGRAFLRSVARILVGVVLAGAGTAGGYYAEIPWAEVAWPLRVALGGGIGLLLTSMVMRWTLGRR